LRTPQSLTSLTLLSLLSTLSGTLGNLSSGTYAALRSSGLESIIGSRSLLTSSLGVLLSDTEEAMRVWALVGLSGRRGLVVSESTTDTGRSERGLVIVARRWVRLGVWGTVGGLSLSRLDLGDRCGLCGGCRLTVKVSSSGGEVWLVAMLGSLTIYISAYANKAVIAQDLQGKYGL
jgi:hypothetical protein